LAVFNMPYGGRSNTTSKCSELPSIKNRSNVEGSDDQESNCCVARESNYELVATVLASVAAVGGSFVLRVAFNALIRRLNKRKGEILEHDILPFPAWELQVFLITFTGLAESAGVRRDPCPCPRHTVCQSLTDASATADCHCERLRRV
jgi:hypothetical protein